MDARDPLTFAALLSAGMGAGFLSTLFGIGGGILVVPVLHYGLGVPLPTATATSLMAMMVHPVVGVLQHSRKGVVDWRIGSLLSGSGALGVAIGLLLLLWITTGLLKLLFAGVLVFGAWRLLAKPPGVPVHHVGTLTILGLGFVSGVASRLFGIGGGLVTVPLLALEGTPMHVAIGSSLIPVFTNAVIASAISLYVGLDWFPAVPLTIGAVAAATFGTKVAHAIDAVPLRRTFAVALVVAAIYIGATSRAFW